MATVTQLRADIEAEFALLGTVRDRWSADEQLLPASESRRYVKVRSVEIVRTGSNQAITWVEVDLTIIFRATSGSLTDLDVAEQALDAIYFIAADPATWVGIASVRQSPYPEVEFPDEPERIGNVYTYTIRARVALED